MKVVSSFLISLIALAVSLLSAPVSALRGDKPTDVTPVQNANEVIPVINGTDDSEGEGGRQLGSVALSCKYKYQKKKDWIFGFSWKDTDYRWCVDSEQSSCFPTSIGDNEFWDDDRIKYMGDCSYTPCAQRKDIGSGTCSYDSDYKDSDWTGGSLLVHHKF